MLNGDLNCFVKESNIIACLLDYICLDRIFELQI